MKNTLNLLRLTGKIMETWTDGVIPDIEKDTVLDNLRRIYSEIKYPAAGSPEQINEETPFIIPVATRTVPVAVPETVGTAADSPAAVEVTIDLTENPATPIPDNAVEEPSCIVNSEDEIAEVAGNILFSEEEIPAKPKLDKKVLLSLYGDDPAPIKQNDPQPGRVETNIKFTTQDNIVQNIADTTEPVQVLGDVLNNDAKTVGDVYSEQVPKADVASVIGSGKVDGIRKAIGINDKFLIIRNLFEGNASDYDTVISLLDEFEDLDEALIYIHENFNWNPDNEAVKLIIDLLTRKFS